MKDNQQMNHTNRNAAPYDEASLEYVAFTYRDVVERIYEKAKEDSWVLIPDFPYRAMKSETGKRWIYVPVLISQEQKERLVEEIGVLIGKLRDIAQHFPEFSEGRDYQALLGDDLFSAYESYVADLSDGRFEREIELNCDKLSLETSHDDFEHEARHLAEKGSKSCDEELMIFWKTNLQLARRARERVGGREYALDVVFRAKRLFYLFAFEAPEDIIRREEKQLAKSLILNRFAKGELAESFV